METINLSNKFLDFKLFVLPEVKKLKNKDNFCQFLIVVSQQDYNESTQELLKKIIAALKFEFEKDVRVIEYVEEDVYQFESDSCSTVLSFGIPLKPLGIHFALRKYELLEQGNHQFLLADTLKEIANNQTLKGALWGALQQIVKK